MSDELKPCPFCGLPPTVAANDVWTVSCAHCGIAAHGSSETNAGALWNFRPAEDYWRTRAENAEDENARLRAALERAREELTGISIMLYGQMRGFVTPPISDKLAMESLSNKAAMAQRAIDAALEPQP